MRVSDVRTRLTEPPPAGDDGLAAAALRHSPHRPDFLVVSPPKTGSTWLADNLRRHPGLYVPPVKELKYFSSFFKWLGPDWYLDQFAPGVGRVKGEASPSYAGLPAGRIRHLRSVWPDLKLVFLMRDPVGRAWSHAKHARRYGEASFRDSPGGDATADEWRACFVHDWLTAAGDYLGQLRRWLAAFPASQVYVGFYESIAAAPEALLRDVFAFLGVDPAIDLAGFPVGERILPGPAGELSCELRSALHRQLHERTADLAEFLAGRLGLTVPVEWAATLAPPAEPAAAESVRAFARESDDDYLAGVLRTRRRSRRPGGASSPTPSATTSTSTAANWWPSPGRPPRRRSKNSGRPARASRPRPWRPSRSG